MSATHARPARQGPPPFLTTVLAPLLAAAAAAQIGPGRVVVATEAIASGRTVLLEVDPASGVVAPLSGFAGDQARPLQVLVDPVNLDVVVATADPTGSNLLRLGLSGLTVVRARPLATLPGQTVTGMTLTADGIFVTVTGAQPGLYRVARNGGTAQLVLARPDLTAIGDAALTGGYVMIVQGGTASSPPTFEGVDLATGAPQGPWVPNGLIGVRPTGVADLPTGLIRWLITDTQGLVHVVEGFTMVRTIATQPALPPGATRAMAIHGNLEVMALGGASHPYLKTLPFWSGTTWTTLAGPLPGDPVDFALAPAAGARTESFRSLCSTPTAGLAYAANGPPRLGSTTFTLDLIAHTPSSVAWLLAGVSDQAAVGRPLPFALPGGCPLLVSTEAVLATIVRADRRASIPVSIPATPSLDGTRLYVQWLELTTPWRSSDGLALHLGQ